MVTLHAFLAILAGFATMVLLVLVFTGLAQKLAPAWAASGGQRRPSYVLVNLLYSFAAAVAGGYVTASLGLVNALTNVLALGIAVLVVGAISVLQARDRQPIWYQIAVLVLSTAGVFVGGVLRLKLLGLL